MNGTIAIATIGLALHSLAAAVWVGGMFFALLVLRPATGPLEPGPRLELWSRVLDRFFAWVWVAIALLLASGYAIVFGVYAGTGALSVQMSATQQTGFFMIFHAGFSGLGMHINIMQGIGIVMMLLFFHLYFAPWRRFQLALARQDYPAAGVHLAQIRIIVTINLVLGLLTIALGSSGRYWG